MSDLIELLKNIGSDGWEAIKAIGKFLYYLMHPKLLLAVLWHCIELYSFWICLFVALIAFVFYSLGFKKMAKFIPGSIAIYTLIRMIAGAF